MSAIAFSPSGFEQIARGSRRHLRLLLPFKHEDVRLTLADLDRGSLPGKMVSLCRLGFRISSDSQDQQFTRQSSMVTRPISKRSPTAFVRSQDVLLVGQGRKLRRSRGEDEVTEDSGAIRVSRPGVPHDRREISFQDEVNAVHSLNRRLASLAYKNIAERSEGPSHCAAVDADIRAVEIAQRLADPVRHGFTNIPIGSPVAGILGHGKSQFKRHVEARHARSSSVELDTREVVNGVGTSPDELEDSLKTAPAGGDFERRARDQPKSAQTGNVGQIEVFKRSVVGNVQKYIIPVRSSSKLSCGHISRLFHVVRSPARVSWTCARTKSSERALPLRARPQERGLSRRDSEKAC